MNILAVDQGTSATKALVVSPERGVLAEAEAPVHPLAVAGGGVEQDPEELWASVLDAGRRACAQAREPVGAVGLANQGETVLAWDPRDGRPLSVALSWQDRRAAEVTERLADRAGELTGITGLPLDPYFAAPKLAAAASARAPRGWCRAAARSACSPPGRCSSSPCGSARPSAAAPWWSAPSTSASRRW